MTPHLLTALECAMDVLGELVGHHDPRLEVMRQELAKAREEIEHIEDKPVSIERALNGARPTLAQAHGMAEQVGVTAEEAESWWYCREASDWNKGTAGGGIMPIGRNHAADLKTFTNAVRSRNQTNGSNGHAKPEGTWQLKVQLENVEAELGRLEEKKLYDPLTIPQRDLWQRLKERRRELRAKISGVE